MAAGGFKGWKKIGDHKDHAVLQHASGHEMRIAKSALSPKMRGQLAEIPLHKEEQDSNPVGKKSTEAHKGALKMSSGGEAYNELMSKPSEAKAAPAPLSHNRTNRDVPTINVPRVDRTAQDDLNFQDPHYMGPAGQGDPDDSKDSIIKKGLKKAFADGGQVSPEGMPELIPGVPSEASDPKAFDFEQKQAQLAQSMAGNYPDQEALNRATASKALDQLDSEKLAGSKAAASIGADQGAAYQQAVDLNKRLEAQGLPPQPLPPAPAGGTPEPQAAFQGQPSGLVSSQGAPSESGMNEQDPYGLQTGGNMYREGYNQQLAGIGQEAKATGALGQAEAKIAHDAATKEQANLNDYQNHYSDYQAQSDAMVKTLQDPSSQIDPNHYLGSMDTGGRIATAIGLILGGIGSGLTGQENPALKMLNHNIDRDIDAQKANLGTKKNLLEFNMQRTHNLQEATMMTKGMMNDIAAHNMQAAAAAAQDPMAKARAMQAAGQLKQQASTNFRQLAMQKTLMGGMAKGTVSPELAVEYSPILDPKQRDAARKELKDMQDANALRDHTLSAFDQIKKLNTVGSRLGSPIQSSRQIEAIQGPVLDQLTKDTSGRVTPETVKLIKGAFSRMGNSEATNAAARHTIDNLLSQKMHYPTLKILGITPDKYSRFGAQGQSAIPVRAAVPNKKSK